MPQLLMVFKYKDGLETAEVEQVSDGHSGIDTIIQEELEFAQGDRSLASIDIYIHEKPAALPMKYTHIRTVEIS